jgi:hypothetical protein
MMQNIPAYLVLAMNLLCIISLYKKPQIALGLLFGMYAAEQILSGKIPIFAYNQLLYNYLIGAVSVAAIVFSVFKYGFPRIMLSSAVVIFLLLIFSWSSLLWTRAPNAALHTMTHFTLEGVLGFILPFFVIRRLKDFTIVIAIIAVYGVLVTVSLLLFPIEGSGGRVLLMKGGTVLSPANMMGTGMIFVATISKEYFGILSKFRYVLLLLFAIGVFISGARTQFFLGALLSIAILLSNKAPLKTFITASSGFLVAAVFVYMVFPDLVEGQLTASSTRYASASEFEHGYESRQKNFIECFTLENPLVGHGLMGWAYMKYGTDIYMYPHNSVAQVYYELGLIGMVLFLSIIYKSYKLGYANYKTYSYNLNDKLISLSFLAYLTFSFLLSLKQGTFLSCTGVYIAFGCISVVYSISKNKSTSKQKPVQHPKIS